MCCLLVVGEAFAGSPLYDVVLASRNPTAVKLFERANPQPKDEQLGLFGAA